MATYQNLHDWNATPEEAVRLQQEFRDRVRVEPLATTPKTIAGCDISFNRFSDVVYAGVVVLDLATLQIVEETGVQTEARFPYVPGLLSFREIPALLEAWERLKTEPDVVMVDGHGIAHPRKMGIAAHFGLVIDRPAFGCAKSILVGHYKEPADLRGDWSPLVYRDETLGAALRTKPRTKPVYISVGNKIDLPTAIDLTLRCDRGYRIPEPTRQAHRFVNELRQRGSS